VNILLAMHEYRDLGTPAEWVAWMLLVGLIALAAKWMVTE